MMPAKWCQIAIILSVALVGNEGLAQTTFGSQQVISIEADGAQAVFAADLDDDGDLDVLSASNEDDKIAWYENTNGQGLFGPETIITTEADFAESVYATDLDGDNDIDVLSCSSNDHKIAWYENTDGQGTFGPQQVISTGVFWAGSVHATDIDGDGDSDVLATDAYNDEVIWYENTDGQGSFGPGQLITSAADRAQDVFAVDVDGDSDPDVLSASSGDDKIAWYANTDGLGSFGPQQVITTDAEAARSVYAADVDGDGDFDVLSASASDRTIAWFENTNGAGAFGAKQVIDDQASASFGNTLFAADVDGDGDIDILASFAIFDSDVRWYENVDGAGSFGPAQLISTAVEEARAVYAADLDGDGDLDVLSASHLDDKIAWYENVTSPCSYDGQPCDFGAVQDGDLCNSICSGFECVAGSVDCDDGTWCNGTETCNPELGCQAGSEPDCDDGIACTADSCDENSDACAHVPQDGSCDDGEPCNGNEQCDAVLGCVAGTPPDCDDGNWCNGLESCEPGQGCVAGAPPVCDDGIECTIDSCDEGLDACASTPDHDACDNGLFCDGAETCDAVDGCQPGGGDPCIPPTQCDEENDRCSGCSDDDHCDDGVDCTADTCEAGQCVNDPDDSNCDDGLFCNGVETCIEGLGCTSGQPPCSGGQSCDEETDSCTVENRPPSAPTPIKPADMAVVDKVLPRLSIENAVDPDGDSLTYSFRILLPHSGTIYWEVTGVAEGPGLTSVVVDIPLQPSDTYQWRARATDDRGLAGDWCPAALFSVAGKPKNSGGCGCRAANGREPATVSLLLLFALVLMRRWISTRAS